MATRSIKEEKRYSKYRKNKMQNRCVFCSPSSDEVFKETKSFFIIKNKFAYSVWDGQGVKDHLMIVPKKHTDSLSDFSSHEIIEYFDIVSSYEKEGYDLWSRAPKSNRKTVTHLHSHLILLDRKTKKFLFYLNKPYLRLSR